MASMQNNLAKLPLSGKTLAELEEFVAANDWQPFRARQIHSWIYARKVNSIAEMTDLSVPVRERMQEISQVPLLKLVQVQASVDGTRKYLLELPDGNVIESVLMTFDNRRSLSACVSTQVGCAVGCTFCATGYLGFTRNLSAAEIVDQVMCIQRESACRVSNVVYMGQGEPLLNIEEVIKSTHTLIRSVGIGGRHITISTSGIIPAIERLAKERLPLTLALSLHSPDQNIRQQIVPIAETYKLQRLVHALNHYAEATGRRITIEYVLLAGVTDQPAQARQLSDLVKDLHCNINLIPYNPTWEKGGETLYRRPSIQAQKRFKQLAAGSGKTVTIRLERGTDIEAACGQLHNAYTTANKLLTPK